MTEAWLKRNRERFRRFLKKRFSLRFHMFLILTASFSIGLLSSKIMLELHLHSMIMRYPLAVVCSYLAFFGFVKLWLVYLSSASSANSGPQSSIKGASGDGVSNLDIMPGFPSSGGGGSGPSFAGDGGSFSGGGASSSFDVAPDTGPSIPAPAIGTVDSGGSSVGDAAEGVGDAVSGIFDDDSAVLIILGILLVLALGAGVYLIYQAPLILSDAAFQAVLSTGLIRSMKKMSDPDWAGGVFRATALPFLGVLVIAIVAAWVAHSAHPPAVKMSEVLHHLLYE